MLSLWANVTLALWLGIPMGIVYKYIYMFTRRSDVQILDMYLISNFIWKWLRTDAKKINWILCGFLYLHVCNKLRSVSDVSKKKKKRVYVSVNAA